jgi:hypothetical protein
MQQSYLGWMYSALGFQYAILLPLSGMLSAVLALIVVVRGRGPMAGAALGGMGPPVPLEEWGHPSLSPCWSQMVSNSSRWFGNAAGRTESLNYLGGPFRTFPTPFRAAVSSRTCQATYRERFSLGRLDYLLAHVPSIRERVLSSFSDVRRPWSSRSVAWCSGWESSGTEPVPQLGLIHVETPKRGSTQAWRANHNAMKAIINNGSISFTPRLILFVICTTYLPNFSRQRSRRLSVNRWWNSSGIG